MDNVIRKLGYRGCRHYLFRSTPLLLSLRFIDFLILSLDRSVCPRSAIAARNVCALA